MTADWTIWLMWIGGIYVALCLIFYFCQDFFFFRPELLPKNFQYKYPFPFEEVHFDMEDGGYINGLHFKVPNSKGVIYYLKGNSKSVKGWGKFARDFIGKGYDFFMVDYRGFGKSRGKVLEATLYNDAQFVYKWLKDRYDEKEIIVYGRSLGSGIATRVASWNHPQMLILDSPYYSFIGNVKRYGFILPIKWLLKYKIRTNEFIRAVECPIFILHGTKDRLFPISYSQRLQAEAPDRVTLFPIEGAHHNNLPEFPDYHDLIYDILNDDDFLKRHDFYSDHNAIV